MSEEEFQAPQWIRDETDPTKEKSNGEPSQKQKIVLTITLVAVFPFCIWAGWFEFGRAQSGNWRAWVYTFEWPLFAGIAIYLWRRLMHGEMPHIPKPDLDAFEKEDQEK
jgi:hypothetical protein